MPGASSYEQSLAERRSGRVNNGYLTAGDRAARERPKERVGTARSAAASAEGERVVASTGRPVVGEYESEKGLAACRRIRVVDRNPDIGGMAVNTQAGDVSARVALPIQDEPTVRILAVSSTYRVKGEVDVRVAFNHSRGRDPDGVRTKDGRRHYRLVVSRTRIGRRRGRADAQDDSPKRDRLPIEVDADRLVRCQRCHCAD